MDKPFKTIEEQIEILQSRGLETNDETPIILEREGYYSVVNGYKDIFIDKEAKSAASGEDRFVKGASFDDIYRLFRFDRDLRMLLFANLAIAEATLKTIEAYQFGKYHQTETEAYLKVESYRTDRAFSGYISDYIDELKKMVGKSGRPNFKRDYIEHYYRNHDGVPIWVLTNYLTLGQAFKFFHYQTESVRNAIAKSFGALYNETHTKPRRFSERDIRVAYDHIKDFRNTCAHDERLFCAKASPNKNVSFADVVKDLEIVLTKKQYETLVTGIKKLIDGFLAEDTLGVSDKLLNAMGIRDLKTAFPIAK